MAFLKNLLFLSSLMAHVEGECTLGWHHYGDYCYFFSTDSFNWFTAESSCHGHKAKLAEVETKDQSDYLINMVQTIGKSGNYWLGGRDDVIEGTWQWASNDKTFSYTEWGPTQPNNYLGDEDCVELYDYYKWKWNDRDCDYKNHFICQRRYPSEGGPGIIGK